MTLLREYLRNAIATQLNLTADQIFIFFDASRESTIAVVTTPDATDVYFADASSDDDCYEFATRDHDAILHVDIPDFDANDANDES